MEPEGIFQLIMRMLSSKGSKRDPVALPAVASSPPPGEIQNLGGLQGDQGLTELLKSPFVQDTLARIMAGSVGVKGSKNEPALGGFVRRSDPRTVMLNTQRRGQVSDRELLQHEIGHTQNLTRSIPQDVALDLVEGRSKAAKRFTDRYRSGSVSPLAALENNYFTGHPQEYIAQSFSEALKVLSTTSGGEHGPAAQRAREMFEEWPGSQSLLRWMLDNEIWKDHPLNKRPQ